MRRVFSTVGALASAAGLLLAVTVASLIGLNAECNAAASECPRSDANRLGLVSAPIAVAGVLLVGSAISVRMRALWPLVLAEAAALATWAVLGALVQSPDAGTAVLLALATLIGGLALRQRQSAP